MSMWNVDQIAKFARIQRIISKQRRADQQEKEARRSDKEARRAEDMLRDYANEIIAGINYD